MKKALLTILITMIVTAVSAFKIFKTIVEMDEPQADRQEEIDSSILGEERKLLIHLPAGYDPSQSYPVMYVLDGSSQDFRVAGIADILDRANTVPKMIIVGIPNTNRDRDLTPHYILQDTDGEIFGKGDQFLSFLTKEVIPFIESKYPTNQYRMLAGHSRAGLFAYYAYLERPTVFGAIFCFSPAFWRDDMIILDKAATFYASTGREAPFIFMSLGTEENEKMKEAYDAMTYFLVGKKVKNLVHTYTPEANHGNNLYYSTPIALKTWAEQMPTTSSSQ
ncbi:MAG: alpha/beta hydrolase-fold protein [Imperialibacter sp.]|uniref:alpha/beta hydrolase n=1 Tax=Imperialibacter sp. TaxID=2038411 RepID=UPI0032EFEB9B